MFCRVKRQTSQCIFGHWENVTFLHGCKSEITYRNDPLQLNPEYVLPIIMFHVALMFHFLVNKNMQNSRNTFQYVLLKTFNNTVHIINQNLVSLTSIW